MNHHETLFLEALKASLTNTIVNWTEPISSETWQSLFALSEAQKVLPLIFNAVSACPAAAAMPPEIFACLKARTKSLVLGQVQKTAEFLQLYSQFSATGIRPLVVKGAVCRELYPIPELRISADEDLLVSPEEFAKAVDVLQKCGYSTSGKNIDVDKHDEIGFTKVNGASYIELHKYLFSEDSDAYGSFNQYFLSCFENAVSLEVQGTRIDTLEPSMHLFYLICHAFKHFLHSGFGLRQVCDICMFACAYGKEIHWQTLLTWCREIRADKFAAALFKIGKNHLIFDFEISHYPNQWQEIEIDEQEMLLELLQSGIYGSSTMSRRHSAKITLEAASAVKSGKHPETAVLRMAFPPAKDLERRYPYLNEKPYLLPAAWFDRLITYHREIKTVQDNTVTDAVKIGKQRVELLKKYGMIEGKI